MWTTSSPTCLRPTVAQFADFSTQTSNTVGQTQTLTSAPMAKSVALSTENDAKPTMTHLMAPICWNTTKTTQSKVSTKFLEISGHGLSDTLMNAGDKENTTMFLTECSDGSGTRYWSSEKMTIKLKLKSFRNLNRLNYMLSTVIEFYLKSWRNWQN